MAKRRTYTTSSGNRDMVKFCAFWGMTIAALFYLFSGFINFLIRVIKSLHGTHTADVLSTICSIFTLLGNIAIIIAIAIPAWRYVSYRSNRGWRVFYWIMLVVFAFGVVLGMIGNII